MTDRQSGLRMRNRYQFPSLKLAPAAQIPVPQLDEVDWPLKLASPFPDADFSLAGIDLHQGPRPDQGIERRVLETDIPVYGLAQIEVLQKTNGNLVPLFDDPRQKVRSLEPKLRLEFNGKRYALRFGVALCV